MNWIALNGSPRGKESNSTVMLNWIDEGYGENIPRYELNQVHKHDVAVEAFLNTDNIFLIIPLYVDSMPAQVMKFFEQLIPYKDKIQGKGLITFIHSGFPEGQQSFTLRKIMKNICDKLALVSKGIIIRGGSEPTRLMPEAMQKKDAKAIKAIGCAMKEGTNIPQKSLDILVKPVSLGPISQIITKIQIKLGLVNTYWNSQLKQNHALDRSFDKPYK